MVSHMQIEEMNTKNFNTSQKCFRVHFETLQTLVKEGKIITGGQNDSVFISEPFKLTSWSMVQHGSWIPHYVPHF